MEGGGAGQLSQIDAFDGIDGGGAGEGTTDIHAAGFLPKMLFFEGSSVVALGMGATVRPPKGIWSHRLLSVAYYASVPVLALFGVWLLKLSFLAAGNPNRHTLAKAVMWATLAPLLLITALHVLANPNSSQ